MVGLDVIKGLFQSKRFYDSMVFNIQACMDCNFEIFEHYSIISENCCFQKVFFLIENKEVQTMVDTFCLLSRERKASFG